MTAAIDLSGRRALVTGSVTGIGRAITEALAEAGAAVVAHGLEDVETVAREWRARGFVVAESTADLSHIDGIARLKADLGDWGMPDILVLNASIEILEDWTHVTPEAMATQTRVNIHAPMHLLQAFVPEMVARDWGRVLAMGSVQEDRPNPSHMIYAATKAAQTSLIRNMAHHLRAPNVTFNILKPGAIATDRNRARLDDDTIRQSILAQLPLGRIGTPADCIGAVLLLCSDAGAYINGAELTVDGGLHL